MDIAGRHFFITGGTRGIGHAVVLAAAARGARVSFVGRDAHAVRHVEDTLLESGAVVAGYPADVTDEAGMRDAVANGEARFGGVDVLVNNAGRTSVHGPISETSLAEWWHDVSVNLLGVAICAAATLPSMIARGHGRIINMVSGAAGRATPYNTAYACSKAAVVRLTDSLAEEVREHGIAVFALRPGNVQTDMLAGFVNSASARRWLADELNRLRPQTPDRAVAATLWLAEGHGDALTGRWVDADDDLETLARRAEDITTHDLQQLRRARLSI